MDDALLDAEPEDLFETVIEAFIVRGRERGMTDDQIAAHWEEKQGEILAEWPSIISETTDTGADAASTYVLARVRRFARKDARDRRRFERAIQRTWGRALDHYRMFYNCALEVGGRVASLRAEAIEAGTDDGGWRLGALLIVHARACTTASEIHALLRTGHPNGAHARWRTLHELAVVAFLLEQGDEELGERFVRHAVIGSSKFAVMFQKYADALGEEPLTAEEEQELQTERAALETRFGPGYKSDWGWALPLFPGRVDLKFHELADKAGLAHHAPYVSLAVHYTHGGSKGTQLNEVEFPDGTSLILGGATNVGLAEPGSGAVIALNHVTIALLNHREAPTLRELIEMQALQRILAATLDAFADAAGVTDA